MMMMMSRNNRTMRLLRWQSLVVLCFCPITVVQALWLPTIFFGTDFAPESLLDDAPWIFRGGPVTLPVTLEECWAIVTDDASTQYWLPEVQNIENLDPPAGLVGRRQVDLYFWNSKPLLHLLLGGSVTVDEHIDIWEDASNTTRRWSLYFARTSRPKFLFVDQARDEFRCDSISGNTNTTAFTFTAAQNPGFFSWLSTLLVRPRLNDIFAEQAPARLLQAIEDGTLPRSRR